MDFQHFLQGLGFYLLPSLVVALIPTGVIIFTTLLIKSFSNWKLILLCLFAGIFMWCYLAYWSMQGFLISPLGVDAPRALAVPFAIIGGIVAGFIVYRGANQYSQNRDLFSIFLMAIGYFIFVLLTFFILNNRGVS
jgi:hypothetical protein